MTPNKFFLSLHLCYEKFLLFVEFFRGAFVHVPDPDVLDYQQIFLVRTHALQNECVCVIQNFSNDYAARFQSSLGEISLADVPRKGVTVCASVRPLRSEITKLSTVSSRGRLRF